VESDLTYEALLNTGDEYANSLNRQGELCVAFQAYMNSKVGRRKNLKWVSSMYPWESSNGMNGNYRYNGGPLIIGSEGYVSDYNGRVLAKDIMMRYGGMTKWEIDGDLDEEELGILRAMRNYEEDWKKDGNLDMELGFDYLGLLWVESINFPMERTKQEKEYIKHLYSLIYSHEARMLYSAYMEKKGMRELKHLVSRTIPGDREGYRHSWLKEREGIAYRKAANKKYDYYYYTNPIPQEYYTVGREYWMPSKLYLEDIITDADKIDREIIAYEINRYLLLRYDFPLEILLVNALTGFDIGVFFVLIF